MEKRIDSIDALLTKYAGGQMPPLVDMENPRAGLVNGELLQIYHSGLLAKHSIPLGILLAERGRVSLNEKWKGGNFRLNELAKPHWPAFCTKLRETLIGNEICENCDRRQAIVAEQMKENGVITYLCDNGLVDYATPISVKDQVVAVLLCGQFKPREGSIWNPEFIQPGGLFRPLESGEEGVDAWAASLRRVRDIEQRVGLAEGTLLKSLSDSVNPAVETSPQEVVDLQELLRHAADQLSDLASSTYELEKGKVVNQIRNHITSSLVPLGASEDSLAVWKGLSDGLAYVTRYFMLDYCLILSLPGENGREIRILSHLGLPQDKFPMGKSLPTAKPSLSRLRDTVCESEEPVSIVLRDHKDLPIFDQLHHLHKKSKQQVVVIPLPARLESATLVMVLGRFKQDTEVSTLGSDDCEALDHIAEAIALVAEIVLLVEELDRTASAQALFLEDVAHNIRTPIQNIVFEAEVLTRGLAFSEEIERRVRRIAAQVRRLHLMSEKAWTLVNIDRGVFAHEEKVLVYVYQTIMEQRKSLLDLAEKRNLQISVDRKLENWSAIRVNKGLFSQAVLNLMDNAVKYSRDGTEVRVDGKRVPGDIVGGKHIPGGVILSFVNRGIPVREEEKDKIFERYYRADEAKDWIQMGTGIGLAIVKAFADYHGGNVEVKSEPVPGTRDYVTEFRIFIPQKGE